MMWSFSYKVSSFFYIRYMDDWVILAKSRWALRRAIVVMNQILARLGFVKHPDKTWIGRLTEAGIECLGVQIMAETCSLAGQSVKRVGRKLARLYEQHATPERVSQYLTCWVGWAKGHGIRSAECYSCVEPLHRAFLC